MAEKNFLKCSGCRREFPTAQANANGYICPMCGRYLRVPPRARVWMTADPGTFAEIAPGVTSVDFLGFPGYADKLSRAKAETGENSAVLCGEAEIGGNPCALFIMDSRFIMASMGSAVGEKITRTFEYARARSLPVIGFTASGGARMQEGIVSLMQMAKVSGAVKAHAEAGNLYVSVLTDPTTGGVTASFAMQADIILAEPKALVGFAGRRVVEQTTKSALPDNFQSAEFVAEHGFIDQIVARRELRPTLARILMLHRRSGITL